jgi:cysteinyl-tRNA synthetase
MPPKRSLNPEIQASFWGFFYARNLKFMSLHPQVSLFNTLSQKKEVFEPIKAGEVSIYGCGPTVYGLIHVGNARAFLVQDLLVKTLEAANYRVTYARNYTDVDDKIIKKANEEGVEANEISERFIAEFDKDTLDLGLRPPNHKPKVTDHMADIIKMVQTLINTNHAYIAETPFGTDVYFRVSAFKEYGKLSKRPIDELLNQSRIAPGEQKEAAVDFVLWKAAKPGEPSWPSPWGDGRPGWNIECSAMIDALFPDRLDIHLGGSDLVFPHHENEIAQSEACDHSRPLARYWVHNGMLQIQRVKMSKSVGNFMTLRDFLEGFGPEVLRLLVNQTHYHSLLDFGGDSIIRSEILLEKLYKNTLEWKSETKPKSEAEAKAEFFEALYDDLNSAKAIGLVFKRLKSLQKSGQNEEAYALWQHTYVPIFQNIIGILKEAPSTAIQNIRNRRLTRSGLSEVEFQNIESLLTKRWQLKEAKSFAEADDLRKKVESMGIQVMDSPEGWTWTPVRQDLESSS